MLLSPALAPCWSSHGSCLQKLESCGKARHRAHYAGVFPSAVSGRSQLGRETRRPRCVCDPAERAGPGPGASHMSREPHVGAGWESRPRVSQRSCDAPGGVTRALQVALASFSSPLQRKQPQTPELTASSAPTEPYLQKQAPVRYSPGLQLPSPWPRLGFGGPDLSCVALSRGRPL